METITYSAAREKLAMTMDAVCADHVAVVITRQSAPSVVMLSLEDFQSMEETAYLLKSPANAARLIESLAQANAGEARKRKLAR